MESAGDSSSQRDTQHLESFGPAGHLASPPLRDYMSVQQTPMMEATNYGPPSGNNSQNTTITTPSSTTAATEHDRVFTPSASEASQGRAEGTAQITDPDSSQEDSHPLLQLSELAATHDRMPVPASSQHRSAAATFLPPTSPQDATSRKRMADGAVKHVRQRSSASPVFRGGHSRNTSAVSVASTSASRISELSSELKTRLSYAMVKVSNGWQSHSIDQVESLAASQVASPTSSTWTANERFRSSASPRLPSGNSHRMEGQELPQNTAGAGPSGASLAPPISLQPSQPMHNSRRSSNSGHTRPFLSAARQASPHTPVQASPVAPYRQRLLGNPTADPILFSPDQNVREKDAIESLLFMSSPNNSANLKHATSVSTSILPSLRNPASSASSPGRTGLPGSQPRRILPSSRPPPHAKSTRRSSSDKSKNGLIEMDVDEKPRVAYAQGGGLKRVNGATPHRPKVSLSSGIGVKFPRDRTTRSARDIDQMLSRMDADDSSDSDGEIHLPQARSNSEAVGV